MSRLAKNWPFFASDPKAKEIKKKAHIHGQK